jgi:hypothetical protein
MSNNENFTYVTVNGDHQEQLSRSEAWRRFYYAGGQGDVLDASGQTVVGMRPSATNLPRAATPPATVDQPIALPEQVNGLPAGVQALMASTGVDADNGQQELAAASVAADAGVFNTPTPAGEVSDVARERVRRHEAHAASMGLVMDPPIYAPGTRVVSLGDENFRLSRQAHEDQPLTVRGLADARDAVRAERRRSVLVRVGDLRMNSAGALYRDPRKPLPISLAGQGRLLSLLQGRYDLFPGAGRFMAVLDPEERARAFNSQMDKLTGSAQEEELKLRLRWQTTRGVEHAAIFAATSPTYREVDADILADYVQDAIAAKFDTVEAPRGAVVYDPARGTLRADALFHADHIVDVAAGDVFKGGIQFRTSDVGGGSIRGDLVLWRNLCLNLIIIDRKQASVMRLTHRGDNLRQRVAQGVWAAVDKAEQLVLGFAADWGIMRRAPLSRVTLWGESFQDAEEVLRYGLGEGKIKAPQGGRLSTEDVLKALAAEDRRDSLADAINALTRAAHEAPLEQSSREAWERYAGSVLMPQMVRAARAAL